MFDLEDEKFKKIIRNVQKILATEPHLSDPKYRRALIWRYWVSIDGVRPPFRQSDWLDWKKMTYPDTITRACRKLSEKRQLVDNSLDR